MPPETPAAAATRAPRVRWKRVLAWGLGGALALLVVIQLVPYGRDHAAPAATKQAVLPTPGAQAVFDKACADCHSYETSWLWYTNVAPVSWLASHDVEEGRRILDLSTWDRPQPPVDRIVDAIEEGEMPPLQYVASPYHWNARLTSAEKDELVAGFRALYASDPPPIRGGR